MQSVNNFFVNQLINVYLINQKRQLIEMKILKSIDSWDPIQVKFLEMHKYYTKTCIQKRRPGKIERLREIKDRLKGPNME